MVEAIAMSLGLTRAARWAYFSTCCEETMA